jgi:hypothetical protein
MRLPRSQAPIQMQHLPCCNLPSSSGAGIGDLQSLERILWPKATLDFGKIEDQPDAPVNSIQDPT